METWARILFLWRRNQHEKGRVKTASRRVGLLRMNEQKNGKCTGTS
jgi:hypothetical protein